MSTTVLAPAVVDELTRPAVRAVQEAITTALPCSWDKRAEDLENARPRPGDFNGLATVAELAARDAQLREQAAACREHAQLLRRYPTPIGEDLEAIVVAIIGGGDDR